MNNQIIQKSIHSFSDRKFIAGDYLVLSDIIINKPIRVIFSCNANARISVRYQDHFGVIHSSTNYDHTANKTTIFTIYPIAHKCLLYLEFLSFCKASLDIIEGAIDDSINNEASTQIASILSAKENFIEQTGVAVSVPNAGLPRDIWDNTSNYPLLGAIGAQLMQIASTSASDTGIINVVGFKDASSKDLVVQPFSMTGTTPVNIGYWLHIIRLEYLAPAGNVGTIRASLVSSPATIVASIRPTISRSFSGLIYVPNGRKFFIKSISTSVRSTALPNASGYFRTVKSGIFSLELPFTIRAGSVGVYDYDYKKIIEGPAALIPSVFANSVNNSEFQIIINGYML